MKKSVSLFLIVFLISFGAGWLIKPYSISQVVTLKELNNKKISPKQSEADSEIEFGREFGINGLSDYRKSVKKGVLMSPEEYKAVLNSGVRGFLEDMIYSQWVAVDPEGAYEHALTRGLGIWGGGATRERENFLKKVILPWSKLDLDNAASYIADKYNSTARYLSTASIKEKRGFKSKNGYYPLDLPIQILANEWARTDFYSAFSWIKGLDTPYTAKIYLSLIRKLTTFDTDKAQHEIEVFKNKDIKLASSYEFERTVGVIAGEIAKEEGDFGLAKEFILKYQADSDRKHYKDKMTHNQSFSWAIRHIANTDPKTAALILSQHPEIRQDAYLYKILKDVWTWKDPVGAFHWALQRNDQKYIKKNGGDWSQSDTKLVKQFEAQGAAAKKDLFINSYISTFRDRKNINNFPKLMKLSQDIKDLALRKQYSTRLLNSWEQLNKPEMLKYIKTSKLISEQERSALLEKYNK